MDEAASRLATLSDVSTTGLLTAFAHAAESRSEVPILKDPWAEAIVDRLTPLLADTPSPFYRKLRRYGSQPALVLHLTMRARQYDRYARAFAARHPGATVVNLGCGLDTRFWRIDDGGLHLYDLDLPEMIALKRVLVEETDRYHLVGQSVLDPAWRDRLATEQTGPFLFLAEGLFMYLPPDDVRSLVVDLRSRFAGSELVFEAFNTAWFRPCLKWMIDVKLQKAFGLGKGVSFRFGIRDGHEVESWAPGIRLLEEWSYVDEEEPRLGAHRLLRISKLLRYTQWTVRYGLGPEDASEPEVASAPTDP
ncbi:MAG: class I SAM-dependent methyltransferase [Deltaproteobacteria bacterium]|nr:class I SAM-dependent methyltransferase [Deltaproteobacteria bacterium]